MQMRIVLFRAAKRTSMTPVPATLSAKRPVFLYENILHFIFIKYFGYPKSVKFLIAVCDTL